MRSTIITTQDFRTGFNYELGVLSDQVRLFHVVTHALTSTPARQISTSGVGRNAGSHRNGSLPPNRESGALAKNRLPAVRSVSKTHRRLIRRARALVGPAHPCAVNAPAAPGNAQVNRVRSVTAPLAATRPVGELTPGAFLER